jgi:hypothetical protein
VASHGVYPSTQEARGGWCDCNDFLRLK